MPMRNRLTLGVLASWQVYAGTLHSFLGPLYRGIRSAAREMRCNLLLSCGVGPPTTVPWNVRPAWPVPSAGADFCPVGPWNVDGLVVVTPLQPAQSHYIRELIAGGFPVVFAGAGERGPTVAVDNEGGVRQAVAHLAEHGHRRVAFIAASEVEDEAALDDSTYRRTAYLSAIREFGLEGGPNLIVYGHNSIPGGRQAARQLLEAGVPFSAVVANNDEAAIGAIDGLREAGLLVPQDVAVIGFDDRLEAAAYVPPLTTVHHPTSELGYQAALLLLQYIDGHAEGEKTLRVPTRLVIRESCGCLPGTSIRTAIESAVAEFETASKTEPREKMGLRVASAMGDALCAEMQRMSPEEVHRSCARLVEAFVSGLEEGDSMIFRLAIQQVLQRVMTWGDDPYAWQAAVSILREKERVLLEGAPHSITRRQVEDLLDHARIAISETARNQYSRHLMRQADIADRIEQMAARFLVAGNEDDIFEMLIDNLPGVGIQHAAVGIYEREGDDPVAWSVLHTPHVLPDDRRRFPSRQFPPEGLYPADEPWSLALLPLQIQADVSGFVAFDAGNLAPCAAIARQLAAALRTVRLYQEAVEGQRLAEEANRLKGRFLAVVSHELRTPLNLIIGVSDILLQEAKEPTRAKWEVGQEDVRRIHASAQHLDGLIRNVLDLARSEAGQLKLVQEPLDLVEVLEVVVAIGEQLAQAKGLGWRTEIPKDLPQIWGDRTRLRQVALNLVNNAIKFTARGEIVLTAAADDDDGLIVGVRDTGLGIPLEEQTVIFDEFRQSERTTARGYGGLGLGLAICKRLVELHGGRIGVLSLGKEGAGSTFYFTLPAMEHQPPVPETLVPLTQAQQVLLLVKDASGGEYLKAHLVRQGFEVIVHQVDERADWLTWLLAGPPEAVVLDLGLASESGWEVLRVLKGNPATQNVPVLFYSVSGDEDSGSVLEMGYLTKPVGTSELAEALTSQGLRVGEDGAEERKKILIVDDEPGVLEMHARIVETQLPDAQVLRAQNGREALDVMHSQQPDLVLLDLMMPELDGFGVLEAMRERGGSRNIPVIVLTGQVLNEEDMARLNRGVASVLGKGLFTAEETLEHVEAALTQRQKLGAEPRRFVRKALVYLHEHYAEPISRKDVASHVGLSQGHLTRCFRQEMGVTPITYLNRYRVKQAKALLESGEKSVTDVAMAVGFSDSHYFARVFRREVGMSPSAYRREL